MHQFHYLEKMFTHVIPKVFEESYFLCECIWEHLQRVKMFLAISFDILDISVKETNIAVTIFFSNFKGPLTLFLNPIPQLLKEYSNE